MSEPIPNQTRKVIHLYVGSNKELKAKAILCALKEQYPDYEFVLHLIDVNSNVPSQPFNQAVFRGVENRIKALRKIVKNNNGGKLPENCMFAVCEAGILIQADGNFYNVQVVGIQLPNSDSIITGLSPGLLVPRKYILEMLFRKFSISDVFQKHLGTKRGMEYLTGSNRPIDRGYLITLAGRMAIAGVKFKDN